MFNAKHIRNMCMMLACVCGAISAPLPLPDSVLDTPMRNQYSEQGEEKYGRTLIFPQILYQR